MWKSQTLTFFLLATPTRPIKLGGLYSVQSEEYRAIAKPPSYRQNGFDLDPHTPVQYVRGETIRRASNWRKGLELWQDGTLIFVGRNDEEFLGWASSSRRLGENLYINNYVLTEVVSLFFALTVQIFSGLQDLPEQVLVYFGFLREGAEGATYELSPHPISQQFGNYEGNKVSAENKMFWTSFAPKGAIPEVEALKLLKEIYHWFGITDEAIPYVDSTSIPPRVDKTKYVGPVR